MPYKSLAQERLFHSAGSPVSKEKVAEFDAATKGKKLPQRLARGGEIAPLKTSSPADDVRAASPYKVLKEEQDHFVVSHVRNPDKAFRVAKFGLGHKTLHHIRGQMVQHLDEGGPVLNSTFAEDQGAGQAPEESGAIPRPKTYASLDESMRPGEKPVGMDASKDGDGYVTQATSGNPKDAAGGQDFYGPNTPSLLEKQYDSLFGDQAKPPEQQAPQKTPGVPGYNGMPELDRRQKQYEQGQRDWASAMDSLGQEQAKIREAEVAQRNAVAAKAEQDRQAMTAKIDQTVNDIKNFKIDPERHWGTGSTAVFNKTLAGIGMIISGAGAGYTGQPNMAMQVINKAIDRDIDAQKTDLANKHSLLNVYFKQYGNINDAETRAKLDLTANVQAQLDMALAKAKGPVAQAQIQQQMAENGMRMVQMRDQLVNSQAQRANAAVDMQLKQFQLQMEKKKLDMFQQLSAHTGQGGGVDANAVAAMKFIDPKRAESFARGPDGQFYEARDAEAARAVDKVMGDEQPFLQNITRATRTLAKLGPLDRLSPEALRSPEAQALVTEIQDAIQQTTRAANGLGRFTGEEGKRNEVAIGNWRLNPKAAVAALQALGKTGTDRIGTVMRQSFLSDKPSQAFTTEVGTRSAGEK